MASYINAVRVGQYTFDIVRLQCAGVVMIGPINREMVVLTVILVQPAVVGSYPEIAGMRVFDDATDRVVADGIFVG